MRFWPYARDLIAISMLAMSFATVVAASLMSASKAQQASIHQSVTPL